MLAWYYAVINTVHCTSTKRWKTKKWCNSQLTWRSGAVWVFDCQFELLNEVVSVETPLLPDVQQSLHVLFTVFICFTAGTQKNSRRNRTIGSKESNISYLSLVNTLFPFVHLFWGFILISLVVQQTVNNFYFWAKSTIEYYPQQT